LLSILLFTGCTSTKFVPVIEKDWMIPWVEREFCAVWNASIANINWPSEPGWSPTDQQQEVLFLLPIQKNHNFNAVILHLQPQYDGLYQIMLEPWSYFLSGVQGLPPAPFYDPLEFWILEAYNHGLELPDEENWLKYPREGGTLSHGDWRRESLITFINHLYQVIRNFKPQFNCDLRFFCIWRPHYPAHIRGFNPYNKFYTNVRLSLNEGRVDYWTPQIYWPINQIPQSFPVLLG
jgi:uncharacterized lipoprotein YddW (UPF0748 family)